MLVMAEDNHRVVGAMEVGGTVDMEGQCILVFVRQRKASLQYTC
jgi:hypothetical protein